MTFRLEAYLLVLEKQKPRQLCFLQDEPQGWPEPHYLLTGQVRQYVLWSVVCLLELSTRRTQVLEKLAGNSFINRKDLFEPLYFFPLPRTVLKQTTIGVWCYDKNRNYTPALKVPLEAMTIADIIKTHLPEASGETLLLSPLFSIYPWHMVVGRRGEKRGENEICIFMKEPTAAINWHQLLKTCLVISVWPYALHIKQVVWYQLRLLI